MTNPTPEAEHLKKALEAAIREWGSCNVDAGIRFPVPQRMSLALQAADPHLERMYFERFAERLLEHEVKADATRAMNMAFNDAASDFEQYEAAIKAALDSIREGKDG